MVFNDNSNPVNVCNRVMKRLTMQGKIKQLKRNKDECYLYTLNPSPISHSSNKIKHQLKIIDLYIKYGMPDDFIIEPEFGSYIPDVFYRDDKEVTFCIEVQLTPISRNKMQTKINNFVAEYGKEHNARILVLFSNNKYSGLTMPKNFKIIRNNLPSEIFI